MEPSSYTDSCTENDPDVQFYPEKKNISESSSYHENVLNTNESKLLQEVKRLSQHSQNSSRNVETSCKQCDIL